MADDVWAWCENTGSRGRTVTVKIKWADFKISTRSRSLDMAVETRERLHQAALDLVRSVFPPAKGHRFVVTVRDGRAQPVPAPATSAFAREVCGGSRLVNENEFPRIEIELPREPLPASTLHVCALLFLRMRRFF